MSSYKYWVYSLILAQRLLIAHMASLLRTGLLSLAPNIKLGMRPFLITAIASCSLFAAMFETTQRVSFLCSLVPIASRCLSSKRMLCSLMSLVQKASLHAIKLPRVLMQSLNTLKFDCLNMYTMNNPKSSYFVINCYSSGSAWAKWLMILAISSWIALMSSHSLSLAVAIFSSTN